MGAIDDFYAQQAQQPSTSAIDQYYQTQANPQTSQSFPGGVAAPVQSQIQVQPHIQSNQGPLGGIKVVSGGFNPDNPDANGPMTLLNSDDEYGQKLNAQAQANKEDTESRRANIAAQTEQALGAKYDPDALSNKARFDVGMAGDGLVEKEKALKENYPQGSMTIKAGPNGEQFYVYKTSGEKDAPSFVLSPGSVEAWSEYVKSMSSDDPEVRTKSLMKALTNTVEDNPEDTAKTIVYTLLTDGTGFVNNAVKLSGASIGINAAANMYNGKGLSSIPTDVLKDDLVNLAGYFPAAAANVGRNVAGGHGILALSDKGQKLLEDTERLKEIGRSKGMSEEDLKKLAPLPSAVTDPHALFGLGKLSTIYTTLASRLLPQVEEHVNNQKIIASEIMRRMSDPSRVTGIMQTPDILNSQEKTGSLPEAWSFNQASRDALGPQNPGVGHEMASDMLTRDLSAWPGEYERTTVTPAYQRARALGDPQFDYQSLINKAQELKLKMQQEGIKNPELSDILDEINGYSQTPPQSRTSFGQNVNQTPNPNVQVSTTPMDTLESLRRRLNEVSIPDANGHYGRDQGLAKDLINTVKETQDNPINAQPGFQDAWREARKAAATKLSVQDNPYYQQFFKAGNQDTLTGGTSALKTALGETGRRPEELRTFADWAKKGIISPEAYNDVIDSEITSLMQNPDKLASRLSSMDPTYKSIVFKDRQAELGELQDYANAQEALKAGKIKDYMAGSSTARSLIDAMFSGSTDLTTDQLNALAKATPGGQLSEDLRNATLERLFTHAAHVMQNDKMVSPNDLASGLKAAVQGSNTSQFLKPTDLDDMHRFLNYFQTISKSDKSLGASIATYAEAERLKELEKEAVLNLLEQGLYSKFITSSYGQKVLYGGGGVKYPGTMLKQLGVFLANEKLRNNEPVDDQTDQALGGSSGNR